jgi:hypothetical protein
MPSDTSLATIPEQQIARQFGKRVAASMEVVSVADRTHEIPRDPETGALIRPADMSDSEWNLHCDAMKSARNVPVYLQAHYNRVDTAMKIEGARGGDLPPVAGYVLHLMEKKVYPVVDVTVNEEK